MLEERRLWHTPAGMHVRKSREMQGVSGCARVGGSALPFTARGGRPRSRTLASSDLHPRTVLIGELGRTQFISQQRAVSRTAGWEASSTCAVGFCDRQHEGEEGSRPGGALRGWLHLPRGVREGAGLGGPRRR